MGRKMRSPLISPRRAEIPCRVPNSLKNRFPFVAILPASLSRAATVFKDHDAPFEVCAINFKVCVTRFKVYAAPFEVSVAPFKVYGANFKGRDANRDASAILNKPIPKK